MKKNISLLMSFLCLSVSYMFGSGIEVGDFEKANMPFRYTLINKTRSNVQIIQEFKGWCGLNVMDLGSGQKNDLNTPCKMTHIFFGIDKKLLTCPITKDCISKDNYWQTNKPEAMEPGVWVIEELKDAQSVPKPEDDEKFGVLERIVMPMTPTGKIYTIARCKPDTLYLRFY